MLKRMLLMLAAAVALAFTVGGCQDEWYGGSSLDSPFGNIGQNDFYNGANDGQAQNNNDFGRSRDLLQHEFNRDVGNPGGTHYDSHGPEY